MGFSLDLFTQLQKPLEHSLLERALHCRNQHASLLFSTPYTFTLFPGSSVGLTPLLIACSVIPRHFVLDRSGR